MMLAAKMDEFGRGGWIAAMVLGFILWWPAGLAILAFLGFSGRLHRANWSGQPRGQVYNMDGRLRLGPSRRPQPVGRWWRRRWATERQPGVRRLPRRDAAPAGAGAAGVRRLSGTAAPRQGQGGVRPVHGRSSRRSPVRRADDLPARRHRLT